LVNAEFSNNELLKGLVFGAAMERPVTFSVGGEEVYMTIQQRGSEGNNPAPFKGFSDYVAYWMQALARVHTLGTEVMNKKGVKKLCTRSSSEKNDARISEATGIYEVPVEKPLRKDVEALKPQEGDEFCHGDFRYENRLGKRILDWGCSGLGNGLADCVNFLSEACVNYGRNLTEGDFKQAIGIYLAEKMKFSGAKGDVSDNVLKIQYGLFNMLKMLYSPKLNAVMQERENQGIRLTEHELKTVEYNREVYHSLEKEVRGLLKDKMLVSRIENGSKIVYTFPEVNSCSYSHAA
jgi:hypothetical protein